MQAEQLAVGEALVEGAPPSGLDVEEQAGQSRQIESYLCFVRFGCGCRPEEPVGVALSQQDRDAAHTRRGVLGVGVLDELL